MAAKPISMEQLKQMLKLKKEGQPVDSCHVDPGFLYVDPPGVTAIIVRA